MSDFDPDEVILDPQWKRQGDPVYKFRWRHDDIVWVYDEITNNAYHGTIAAIGDKGASYMIRLLPDQVRMANAFSYEDLFVVPASFVFDTEQEARRHIHYAGHG